MEAGYARNGRIRRSPICPHCGGQIHINQVLYTEPFACPFCSKTLFVSSRYPRFWGLVALALSIVVCHTFGARGFGLLVSSALAWLPIVFVVNVWTRHVAPPVLKPADPASGEVIRLGIGDADKE
jgi:uncharacterized paraquat-inducible protein A